MREERRAIDRFDPGRRRRDRLYRVAFVAHRVRFLRRQPFLEMIPDLRTRAGRIGAFIPDHRQRFERGLRVPPRVGDDRDR